ncbi:hypothetical protein DL764_008731 [Monosporascus ibericus]|uniref:ER membrane protein complex subunit 1 n=1 Tax=Monosporascus ibericus TaxID=155417 RepID=A0A4Q4SZ07_9PEZI|nr:hypothetical protein DL764_008731 [Monosporascus ibericus]
MHIKQHFRPLSLSLLLALPAAVRAVFQDEAGHIDYHHELLGVPQRQTTFFHRPIPDEKASLLYTLSDLGVLGAVNPGNGALVWRHVLNPNISDSIFGRGGTGHLRAVEDEKWLASALGSSVQAWDALSGRNVWSLDFEGNVKDLEVLGLTESEQRDVLALHAEEDATVLRRIHGTEGRVVWEHREVTNDVPLQVSTNVEKVFVVTLHGSLLSYSLKVIVLDTLTGKKLDEIPIGTRGEVQKEEDVMFVGSNSAAPVVAWTDNTLTTLKVNVLGTKSTKGFPLIADATDVEIHAPHLVQSSPHFLVHTRTKTGHKGDVFHVDLTNNAITKAYELPLLEGKGAFSTSSLAANVYFTRVTADEVIVTSSQSHGILGRWSLQGGTDKLQALHGVSEVIKKAEDGYAVRSAVVNDADDWVLIRNGELEWTRPEGLSGAVAATWAEIPESEELAKTLEAEAHSNPLQAYIHRVNRHIDDLQYLPHWLQSIPERLMSSILGSEGTKSGDTLMRDSFGFNKLVVLATQRGKLYGLDAGNQGRIIWSKKASETPAVKPWDVKAIHADNVKGFVTVRGAHGEYIIIKSDTGKTIESMPSGLFPPTEGAVLVDSDAGPWLLPIGIGGQVNEIPSSWAPKQTVVTRTSEGGIQGLMFAPAGEHAVSTAAWIFLPPKGQKIVDIASRPTHDPIASIGRVLGDRSVKYKYLNPNTIVVASVDETALSLTIYLLDTISGQVLHSTTYEGVDPSKGIGCTLSENWFACSFYGEYKLRESSQPQSVKGFQLAVSDLYESELSNDRGPFGDGDAANFSSLTPVDNPVAGLPLPAVVSKSYVLSTPLTALAVTQTKQGISARQLLAYAPELRSVIGVPRAALDPRRPAGRDPTPQELEEGLSRYGAALEVDPRWALSHVRDVVLDPKGSLKRIAAAPAVLESTSLVVAYGGVDLFGTRVAPSAAFDVLGAGFNKLALVATVGALALGVGVLGPLVRKKQINMRWGGA